MIDPNAYVYIAIVAVQVQSKVSGRDRRGRPTEGSYSAKIEETAYLKCTLAQMLELYKSRFENGGKHFYSKAKEYFGAGNFGTTGVYTAILDIFDHKRGTKTYLQELMINDKVAHFPELTIQTCSENGIYYDSTDCSGWAMAWDEEQLEDILADEQDSWIELLDSDLKSYNWDSY